MEQRAALLDRLLALKDYTPFILVVDSLAQSAEPLLAEIERRREREVVYLHGLQHDADAAQRIQRAMRPGVPVVGVVHADKPLLQRLPAGNTAGNDYSPDRLALLEFMATSVVRIMPSTEAQQRLADDPAMGAFDFSRRVYNRPSFRVDVEVRRRSGRALTAAFTLDAAQHTVAFIPPAVAAEDTLPDDLTTFRLGLSERQRQDREGVELPFLAAQRGPEGGGAIVYQFEKDDDYDEEDPYEDPF